MDESEDIAIVGMACRFPGGENLDEFWNTLNAGKDAVTKVPSDRWDAAYYTSSDRSASGKMVTDQGGFIGGIREFDADFFGISESEATYMDPQHRLLLETAWEALEHAGIVPSHLAGSATGVFVGSCNHDFSILAWPEANSIYTGTGTSNSVAANRISYALKLTGPSMAIDSACSSSLVALHVACQSLRSGETDIALVGGSNVLFLPTVTASLSQAGLISHHGRCRSFGEGADGYIRGEGVGVIVIMPAVTALAGNHNIICLLRGSASNHNGAANGLTAPNPVAQVALIESAYRRAGVDVADTDYVEAAATGTRFGDAIEMKAIIDGFLHSRSHSRSPLMVGSVKSNIGHLEGAGGIAAVIKTALAIANKQIPASLHSSDLNSMIRLRKDDIEVPQTLCEWPKKNGVACAGVSSFGFGGSNAHVILSEARMNPVGREPGRQASRFFLVLSGKTDKALHELVGCYRKWLSANPEVNLGDLCYSAAVHRSHLPKRCAMTFSGRSDLLEQLAAFHEQGDVDASEYMTGLKKNGLALYLCGDAIRLHSEIRQLYFANPAFHETVAAFDERSARLSSACLGESFACETLDLPEDNLELLILSFAYEYCVAKWLSGLLTELKHHIADGLGALVALTVQEAISVEQAIGLLRAENDVSDLIRPGAGRLKIFVGDDGLTNVLGEPIIRPWRDHGLGRYETSERRLVVCMTSLSRKHFHESPAIKPLCCLEVGQPIEVFIAELFARGVTISFCNYFSARRHNFIRLPHYPFQRRVFWPADKFFSRYLMPAKRPGALIGTLTGHEVSVPLSSEHRFDYFLDASKSRLLDDHRILGRRIVAASTQLMMCIANLMSIAPCRRIIMRNIEFVSQLMVPDAGEVRAQLVVQPASPTTGTLHLVVLTGDASSMGTSWDTTMSAGYELVNDFDSADEQGSRRIPPSPVPADKLYIAADFYDKLKERGYHFGPSYRWLAGGGADPDTNMLRLCAPPEIACKDMPPLHPGVLDAAFQSIDGQIEQLSLEGKIAMPAGIEQLTISLDDELPGAYSVAPVIKTQDERTRICDVRVCVGGEQVLEARGASFKFVKVSDLQSFWGALADNEVAAQNGGQDALAACPSADLPLAIATRDAIEADVTAVLTRVFGSDFDLEALHEPMNTQGVDSLKAMEIRSILRQRYGTDVALIKLMGGISGNGLIAEVLRDASNRRCGEAGGAHSRGHDVMEAIQLPGSSVNSDDLIEMEV